MQLSHLSVRNIRSYQRAELALGSGITLLWGDVGSGKTSLLYAVEMALFGFAEVDPAFLVRHQTTHAEVGLRLSDNGVSYEIRRRFRRLTRKGRQTFEAEENSFAKNGARTQYSATELRQRAIDLLGFPDNPNPRARSDCWRWAVYIAQEQMREVLAQPAEARLETVRKALGVEKYRIAAENATEVARAVGRLAEVHNEVAQTLQHWDRELPERLADRRAAEDRASEAAGEESGARRRVSDLVARERILQEELQRDAGRKAEAEGLRREQAERESRRAELLGRATSRHEEAIIQKAAANQAASEVAELTRTLPDRGDLRRRIREVSDSLATLEDARREYAVLESLRATAAAELDRWSGEAGLLELRESEALRRSEELTRDGPGQRPAEPTPRNLSEIGTSLEVAGKERDRLRRKLADAEREVADLDQLVRAGVCPRCHQAVRAGEFGLHAEEARRRHGQLEIEGRSAEERFREFTEERAARERFERALLRWEVAEKDRQSARALAQQWSSQLDQARAAARRAKSDLTELEPKLTTLAAETRGYPIRLAERDELERRMADADQIEVQRTKAEQAFRSGEAAAALSEAQSDQYRKEALTEAQRLDALAEREAVLREALREGERTRLSAETLAVDLAEARNQLERVTGLRHRYESEAELAARAVMLAEAGVTEARDRRSKTEQARTLARFLGTQFRDGLLSLERRLLVQAQSEFDRLFARYFAALVEDPSLQARSDAAFTPHVLIEGEFTPPEALSGGERTALALAFRLALGSVVRNLGRLRLDSLILDEPTDGFSPEQVERMGELLSEVGVPQIILVSHEAQLAGIADRVVRVNKERGLSSLRDTSTVSPQVASALEEIPVPASRRTRTRRGARSTSRSREATRA